MPWSLSKSGAAGPRSWKQARRAGVLTERPMHGDPKINNVLLDNATGQAVSLIDLDTVKPGLVQYDLGDCLRSGCNPSGEETTDFEAVRFEIELLPGHSPGLPFPGPEFSYPRRL